MPEPITYRDAGVDIDAANQALELARAHIRSTFTPLVATDIGTFGAMFRFPSADYQEPLLVASTDSVGTKLKIAYATGLHDSVGADLVNHCVNDILVQGARPLFFLDYVGIGKVVPETIVALISGLAQACRQTGTALIGGEIAELPGIYQVGEYDLAGTIVGVVERARALDPSAVRPGDLLLGLASHGLHTNGYSLARQVLLEVAALPLHQEVPELGHTLAQELLRVHHCYGPALWPLLSQGGIHAMAHITGGGIPDNLCRALPERCRAVVDASAWPVPPICRLIARLGHVPPDDLYRTFNMGIGFILIAAPERAEALTQALTGQGEAVYRIGRIEAGPREVTIRQAAPAV